MNTKNKNLISLLWIVFVDSLGWGIAFSVFASLIFNEHGTILANTVSPSLRYMVYEVLLAIYSIFMFFFAPVIGGIADYYGRKPALKISMLGLTTGFIFCAIGCYLGNLWFLVLGRIVSGATAGSVSVAQAATVDISTIETKSYYLSILMLVNTLGFSLGPVLGDLLFSTNFIPNGTATFLIGAAMSALGFLSVIFLLKETYVPVKSKEKLNLLRDFSNIKIAFCKPILNRYLTAILFSMVAFGLFFSNIPVFFSRLFPANSSATGLVLTVEAIIFSIALMFGGKCIFKYVDKIKVIITAQLVQLLAYITLSTVINSFAANIVCFTFISFFAGLMYIGLLTLISDVTESDWQGRVMGVAAALSSISWGVGPLLTGGLNNFSPSIAFIYNALLIVIGMLALRFPKAQKKNDSNIQNVSTV